MFFLFATQVRCLCGGQFELISVSDLIGIFSSIRGAVVRSDSKRNLGLSGGQLEPFSTEHLRFIMMDGWYVFKTGGDIVLLMITVWTQSFIYLFTPMNRIFCSHLTYWYVCGRWKDLYRHEENMWTLIDLAPWRCHDGASKLSLNTILRWIIIILADADKSWFVE